MKLYHNPRCQKSREALQLLKDRKVEPELVLYMDESLSPDELQELLDKLNMNPSDLLRKKEKLWKEEYADKELGEDEILLLMIENPQLMERPVFVKGNKAVVGRPPEKIIDLID